MRNRIKKIICGTTLVITLFLTTPINAFADALDVLAVPGNIVNSAVSGITPRGGIDYVPLQPIPGTPPGNSDFKTYLIAAFKIGISVAGVLSVLMLVIAGFQYATTDAFSGKEESKAKMTNVVAGLVLILVSYILLSTVNKDTVSLKLDFGAESVQIGTGFRGQLSYQREQARLNTILREANRTYSESQDQINSLDEQIAQYLANPEANSTIDIENLIEQKTALEQQAESKRLADVAQTSYLKALNEMKYAGTQENYQLAIQNITTFRDTMDQRIDALRSQGKTAEADALVTQRNQMLDTYYQAQTKTETEKPSVLPSTVSSIHTQFGGDNRSCTEIAGYNRPNPVPGIGISCGQSRLTTTDQYCCTYTKSR